MTRAQRVILWVGFLATCWAVWIERYGFAAVVASGVIALAAAEEWPR